MPRWMFAVALCAGLALSSLTQAPAGLIAASLQQQGGGRQRQQQPRDRAATPAGTAVLSGRVLAADTGRPIKHAQVAISGGGNRQSRSTSTDEQGRWQITDLAAGSYTVAASRAGFVVAIYGQRRPLQPGTPIDLGDGQQLTGVDLHLIRGGVITGRVVDEDGEPLTRALVTVQRYQYQQGERQLVAAGGTQSDDRGIYRVFGLAPGEYYVSANASTIADIIARGAPGLAAVLGGPGAAGGRGGRGGFFAGTPDDAEPIGYAPTYYPGVITAQEGTKIGVAPGQEVTGIDFQVQLVPTATIRGVVGGADGPVPVMLVPTDAGGMLRAQMLRAMAQEDGSFTIVNVPPGRYTLIARSGGRWDDPKMGVLPLTVSGQNVSGVAVMLQPGVSVSGNITVESSGTPAPTDYSRFRIDMPDVDPLPAAGGGPFGRGPNATGTRAEKNGTFEIGNLMPGKHYVRVTTQAPWALKSVSIDGQDVTDQPIEIHSGQDVSDVSVVLTDQSTTLAGTVRDGVGSPVTAVTVIAFSSDPQFWHAQSRLIQAVRTGAQGNYSIHGLPPGDYLVLAVDDVETGEWFDPTYLDSIKDKAKSVSIRDGDQKTLDLAGPG